MWGVMMWGEAWLRLRWYGRRDFDRHHSWLHLLQVLRIFEEFEIPKMSLKELQTLAEKPECIWIRMAMDLLGDHAALLKTLKV
jgi:hypothetical protein